MKKLSFVLILPLLFLGFHDASADRGPGGGDDDPRAASHRIPEGLFCGLLSQEETAFPSQDL